MSDDPEQRTPWTGPMAALGVGVLAFVGFVLWLVCGFVTELIR